MSVSWHLMFVSVVHIHGYGSKFFISNLSLLFEAKVSTQKIFENVKFALIFVALVGSPTIPRAVGAEGRVVAARYRQPRG